jgi:hypothetical protein
VVNDQGVITLQADYTKRDPVIREVLEDLGAFKSGLPVLAIFPAERPNEPILLTGIYTQQQLIESIKRAGPSASVLARKTVPKLDETTGTPAADQNIARLVETSVTAKQQ